MGEHPFIRRSKMWPKHTSDAVLEMQADYANAVRLALQHLTPTLTEVADELKVNYRTLQSYASMERGTPTAFAELLVKYIRGRSDQLTALADFLDPLLKAEAERARDVREVQEKREQRIRELEKRWDARDREFAKRRARPLTEGVPMLDDLQPLPVFADPVSDSLGNAVAAAKFKNPKGGRWIVMARSGDDDLHVVVLGSAVQKDASERPAEVKRVQALAAAAVAAFRGGRA